MDQARRFKLTLLSGLTLTVAATAVWKHAIAPQLFPQTDCVIVQTDDRSTEAGRQQDCPRSELPSQ